VLARADGENPGHVVAELDFDHQDDIRRRVPLMEHRRPKLYHGSSAQTHQGVEA
jgi:predicted amidohydrolase